MKTHDIQPGERNCPLCSSADAADFFEEKSRPHLRCGGCGLIFVPLRWHGTREDQKRRYDLHRNSPEEEGYRQFLSRLVAPMCRIMPAGSEGLDFGSGPGPTVSILFSERGFSVRNYDPIYLDDRSLLEKTYDFVTCTETVEHFSDPAGDWERLVSLSRPGGYIGVMTQRLEEGTDFAKWRYRQDFTHVCFYSADTLRWIASKHSMEVNLVDPSVAIFRHAIQPGTG